MDRYEAYALTSMVGDCRVMEMVDIRKGVHCMVPKSILVKQSKGGSALIVKPAGGQWRRKARDGAPHLPAYGRCGLCTSACESATMLKLDRHSGL